MFRNILSKTKSNRCKDSQMSAKSMFSDRLGNNKLCFQLELLKIFEKSSKSWISPNFEKSVRSWILDIRSCGPQSCFLNRVPITNLWKPTWRHKQIKKATALVGPGTRGSACLQINPNVARTVVNACKCKDKNCWKSVRRYSLGLYNLCAWLLTCWQSPCWAQGFQALWKHGSTNTRIN